MRFQFNPKQIVVNVTPNIIGTNANLCSVMIFGLLLFYSTFSKSFTLLIDLFPLLNPSPQGNPGPQHLARIFATPRSFSQPHEHTEWAAQYMIDELFFYKNIGGCYPTQRHDKTESFLIRSRLRELLCNSRTLAILQLSESRPFYDEVLSFTFAKYYNFTFITIYFPFYVLISFTFTFTQD